MSLLFVDGFDHYATADLTKKWSIGNATIVASGRRGGGCMSLSSSTSATLNLQAPLATVILGLAFFVVSSNLSYDFIRLSDNGTTQISFRVEPDGSISVYRSGTKIGQSLPGAAPISGWFYFEMKAVINDTTGAVEVRVNGNTAISLTNVDTKNTANAYVTQVKFESSSYHSYYVDDLYLLDTSGTVNNDFLGDVRVDAYYPTSEGTVQSWTPTPTGTHYTTVDEATPNTTDYVASAVVGDKELFGVTDLVNTPLSIFGVQVNSAAWKTDAGLRAIKNLVRIAGVDYPSSDLDVTDTMRYCRNVWDQNPATAAAWNATAINDAQFGAQVA